MTTNIASWWTVANEVDEIIVDDSLKHTLEPAKKIKSRTRALNAELKKFSGLKHYRQYVAVKTDILRNISDNEETDDEPSARSAITLSDRSISSGTEPHYNGNTVDDEHNKQNDKEEIDYEQNDYDENEYGENEYDENEYDENEYDENEYDENEYDENEYDENEYDQNDYDQNDYDQNDYDQNDYDQNDYDQNDCKQNDCEQEVDEKGTPEIVDDTLQKKCQPTITCTEIVKSKYTIVRDKDDKDASIGESPERSLGPPDGCTRDDEDAIELDELSPETRRIGRLKRINLLHDNSESDSSQDDADYILPEAKRGRRVEELPSSQIIDDSSDSDEWHASRDEIDDKRKVDRSKSNNNCSSVSSSLKISDSDSDKDRTRDKGRDVPHEKSARKSMRSQIVEQETVVKNREARTVVNSISNGVPSEVDSLSYVLRKLCSADNPENSLVSTQTQCPGEMLPRPVELDEFVDREGFLPNRESSTIDIDDIENRGELDGDVEIWLMEIPKSIATDRRLCGKRIVLENEKMKIDDVCYDTMDRHDKSVSCILSVGGDSAMYKTANVKPVGSIVVRHESSESNNTASSLCQSSAVPTPGGVGIVPFPSNLKSRNPLEAPNVLGRRSKLSISKKRYSRRESKGD